MPTKPVRKKINPSRRPVKRSGDKKLAVIITAVVLVIMAGAAYWFLSDKGQPGLKENPSGTLAGPAPSSVNITSTEVQAAILRAKLQLESSDNKDFVKVLIDKALGMDGKEVVYKFDWTINGQTAGDGSDRITGFKRGDRVAVNITPFEGEKAGQTKLLEFMVNNTSPKIEPNKDMTFDGKNFAYQVKANDPDGGELTYALEDAPEGMSIDPKTGLVNWQTKETDTGKRTVKVKVTNSRGAISNTSFTIHIPGSDNQAAEPQK